MDCSNGRQYTQGGESLQVLSGKLEQAIHDIQEVLFPSAQSPCRGAVMSIRTPTHLGIRTRYLSSETKIVELSEQDWYLNVPRRWHDARGIQRPLFDKILLKRNNWCRETMLHEALHRFSVFTSDFDLRRRFSVLEDGITEFLVGYILFKKHPYCYSSWISNSFRECSMTYRRSVRRFYAFCNFVNVKSLIALYFWQPNRTWADAWSQLISNIRNSGYPDFRDVIEVYSWAEPTEYFFEECEERFGTRFRTIYSSRVDYNTLVVDEQETNGNHVDEG